jgi:cation transport protein ChaC
MLIPSQEGPATSSCSSTSEPEFWLFGYGSLIWKPPPFFDKRIPGWVEGYVRRFWQSSQDHRGTPEAPGRVATLLTRTYWSALSDPHHGPAPDRVWGTAYRIPAERAAEVRDYLDIREVNGYSIHFTPFHPAASSVSADLVDISKRGPINCLVYIGTPENPQFVGPQDPQALAEHISKSTGL